MRMEKERSIAFPISITMRMTSRVPLPSQCQRGGSGGGG